MSHNKFPIRKPPRVDRTAPIGCLLRCKFCDWQTIENEGITIPRACCAKGLQFDLDHGLTPDGLGQWCEVNHDTFAVKIENSTEIR